MVTNPYQRFREGYELLSLNKSGLRLHKSYTILRAHNF